jgi:hypothetical protein
MAPEQNPVTPIPTPFVRRTLCGSVLRLAVVLKVLDDLVNDRYVRISLALGFADFLCQC